MKHSKDYTHVQKEFDQSKKIVNRLDNAGNVTYMNDASQEISGYVLEELLGKSYEVLKHPDMPSVIYEKVKSSFENEKEDNFHIIKQLSRDGSYSWVLVDCSIDKDENKNNIGYTSIKWALPKPIIDFIAPLYKVLLDIELLNDVTTSEKYLNSCLELEYNKTYDQFILDLVKTHTKKLAGSENINSFLDRFPNIVIDEEVQWDKAKQIVYRADCDANLIYMNDSFEEASGYSKLDIIGEKHSILFHPDMPLVISKIMQNAVKEDVNFRVIIKNIASSGKYYWIVSEFTRETDKHGNPDGYTGRAMSIPDVVVDIIEPFYKLLADLEKRKDIKASEKYLDIYLKEEHGKTYQEFILDLVSKHSENIKEQKRVGNKKFFDRFFNNVYE